MASFSLQKKIQIHGLRWQEEPSHSNPYFCPAHELFLKETIYMIQPEGLMIDQAECV